LTYYVWGKKKMVTECKNCKKLVEPIFKIDEGIDCLVCPECGHVIGACTDNIQVIGRDM
jgi:DNA-directed RNA polymerase subunit RPC12/RpoP